MLMKTRLLLVEIVKLMQTTGWVWAADAIIFRIAFGLGCKIYTDRVLFVNANVGKSSVDWGCRACTDKIIADINCKVWMYKL